MEELTTVRLSELDPARRDELLARYEAEIYIPAFPDPELREDVAAWKAVLADSPPAPAPRLEVILLMREREIVGGATVEFYRDSQCGLLTYIAVSARERGAGHGRRLVAAAHETLEVLAGGPAFLLAETERLEDAKDAEERSETADRLQRLAGLGAHVVGCDYVMPPLRSGLPARRLHLLALAAPAGGRPTEVDAQRIARFVRELAASLGAKIDNHAELRESLETLSERDRCPLTPLPIGRPDRRFEELAAFPGMGNAAVSFAFRLEFPSSDKSAFLLGEIAADLEARPEVRRLLLEPAQSFLDDVTAGPPGTGGRPLLFLADSADADSPERSGTLTRPLRWRYTFEGEVTELVVPDGAREAGFSIRDAFCAFERGALYYILTLRFPEDAALDEYALIQLEQLALAPEPDPFEIGPLDFTWHEGGESKRGSLLKLAEARLAALEAIGERRTNGWADVVSRYLLDATGVRAPLAARHVVGMAIALDEEPLLTAAREIHAPSRGRPGERRGEETEPERGPTRLPFHGDPDNPIPRTHLALAGLATGVPDFPWQDRSEVHDSTHAATTAEETLLFVHPRFAIEVASDWRSLDKARDTLGTCPYLMLMWLVAADDAEMVAALESGIADMIFRAAPASERFRTEPLAQVNRVYTHARRLLGGDSNAALAANLSRRIELFRWLALHRVGSLFRYPKEKAALEYIQNAMGTDARYTAALERIEQVEMLVEDAASLKVAYGQRRTNEVLGIIAILGLLGVATDLVASERVTWALGLFAAVLAVLALLLLRSEFRRD